MTHYEQLGLTPAASADAIKKAYRQLAVTWHPDKNPTSSHAEDRFKSINEAYRVLSDPQLKAAYDLQLRYGTPLPPPPPPRQPVSPPPAKKSGISVTWIVLSVIALGILVFGGLLMFERYNREQADKEVAEALRLLVDEDSTQALTKLNDAISHNEELIPAYRVRGQLLLHRREFQQAYYDLLKVADVTQAEEALQLELATCSYYLKKYSQSRVHLNKVLVLNPENGRAYQMRGTNFWLEKDTTRACDDWQQAAIRSEKEAAQLIVKYCMQD